MSLGPDKMGPVFDLLNGTAGVGTATGAGLAYSFPPGRKAIGLFIGTGAVMTVKVQNSVDGTNWFDVATATTGGSGNLLEVDSCAPKWRANVTSVTTAATTTSVTAAVMTQQIL